MRAAHATLGMYSTSMINSQCMHKTHEVEPSPQNARKVWVKSWHFDVQGKRNLCGHLWSERRVWSQNKRQRVLKKKRRINAIEALSEKAEAAAMTKRTFNVSSLGAAKHKN